MVGGAEMVLENCPTLSACALLEDAGKVEFANGGPASSGPLPTVAGLNLTVGQWTKLVNEHHEGVQFRALFNDLPPGSRMSGLNELANLRNLLGEWPPRVDTVPMSMCP